MEKTDKNCTEKMDTWEAKKGLVSICYGRSGFWKHTPFYVALYSFLYTF